MKRKNEIITAIHLEYVERQIVINNQLKFSTKKRKKKYKLSHLIPLGINIINKPGQCLSAKKIHC
jgi:hypothetical protein